MVAKYVTVGLKMRCSCFRHDFLVKRQKTEIRGFRASRFTEIGWELGGTEIRVLPCCYMSVLCAGDMHRRYAGDFLLGNDVRRRSNSHQFPLIPTDSQSSKD